MTRYRKKPIEVEAWQVGSEEPIPDWIVGITKGYAKGEFIVYPQTYDMNDVITREGYWLIHGGGGIIKTMSPDIFDKLYEVIE